MKSRNTILAGALAVLLSLTPFLVAGIFPGGLLPVHTHADANTGGSLGAGVVTGSMLASGAVNAAGGISVARSTSGSQVCNTIAQSSLLSLPIPGNLLSTNRAFRITLWGDYLVADAGHTTPNLLVQYGGQTIATRTGSVVIGPNAARFGWTVQVLLTSSGATNSQASTAYYALGLPDQIGTVGSGNEGPFYGSNTWLTVDSTVSQNLTVQVTMGAAATNFCSHLIAAQVELI